MAEAVARGGNVVTDDQASPKVKQIFGEIKSTLRTPFVDLVFRTLAVHPEFLELAWGQLKSNVQTRYFEHQADAVRTTAAIDTAHIGAPPRPTGDAVAVLRVFQYAYPKLLIAVAALRTATTGPLPALRVLPSEEKRQVAPGIPHGAAEIIERVPESADEFVIETLDEIASTLGADMSLYRALTPWPEYMGWAWQSTQTLARHTEYRKVEMTLRRMADEAVLAFPFRMDCSPHTLRLCGMSETDIDSVRDTLDRYSRVLPGVVAGVAMLSVGSEGERAAQRSPFPATVRAAPAGTT